MENRYTIRQLSQLCGLSVHTLRFYEKEGLLQGVERMSSGHRIYEERDLAWLQLIVRMRDTGMPIRELQQLAEWRYRGNGTLADRREVLERHRTDVHSRMEELQQHLALLDRRIELYRALEGDASARGGAGADVSKGEGDGARALKNGGEGEAMKAYYAQRAEHYERIYYRDDPVRQKELRAIEADLCRALAGRQVLEIACGTGFWTHKAAQAAERITATDAAPETLRIARGKGAPPVRAAAAGVAPAGPPHVCGSGDGEGDAAAVRFEQRVTFLEGDAYRLQAIPGEFDAALAMFWFSHVPRARIPSFLDGLHRRVVPGSVVFMADNVYVPGIGGKLIVRPGEADTYKLRELADGSEHEIVKNYFAERELADIFGPISSELHIAMGECFWWLVYKVR